MVRADGVLKDALSARDVQRNIVLFIFNGHQ